MDRRKDARSGSGLFCDASVTPPYNFTDAVGSGITKKISSRAREKMSRGEQRGFLYFAADHSSDWERLAQ
jgi:hypothetical protein